MFLRLLAAVIQSLRSVMAGTPAVVPLFLGVVVLPACSPPGPRRGLLFSGTELLARAPDARTGNARIWFVERSAALSVYLVELKGSQPLQRLGGELRLLVLSGRLRLRSGGEEKVLAAGGYASVPPRAPHRLLREGAEPLRYLAFLSPDSPHRKTIESPGLLRRLEGLSR
jgi:quercetin dioxygenase-like cupin family protein